MTATRNTRVDLPAATRGPEVERDFEFTSADFARIREVINRRAGISLSDHKRDMAYSRLRACGMYTFKQHFDRLVVKKLKVAQDPVVVERGQVLVQRTPEARARVELFNVNQGAVKPRVELFGGNNNGVPRIVRGTKAAEEA